MSVAPTLLLVLLSCDGYWFGGRVGTVSVQYNLEGDARSDTVFAWRLMHDKVELDAGELKIDAKNKEPSQLRIELPAVRAGTTLQLRYKLLNAADRRELLSDESVIHVFPDDLLASLAAMCRENPLLVIGAATDPIVQVLADAGIEHHRSDTMTAIDGGDVVLVLPRTRAQELTGFEQTSLMTAAGRGASVIVFDQKYVSRLWGYNVARRIASGGDIAWREGHPLLAYMEPEDWSSMIELREEWSAVRLPEGDSSVGVVYWPPDAGKNDLGAPVDALMIVRNVDGAGRVVLCQLPMDELQDDPRQQVLLINSIEYVRARAEVRREPEAALQHGGVQ